jgi:hypothetical protein
MYAQLALESSGFADSRMIARITPSTIPIAMATTVSRIVSARPSSTRLDRKYLPIMSHWKRGFVTRVCTSIATRRSTTAAASHRPGWRTGTALISSGGPVRPPVSAVRDIVTCAPGAATVPGPRAGQLIAALIAGLEMAPACTPHLPRIFVYVPSDMRCLTAASIGSAIPLFLGIAIPYGAVP